MTENSAFIFPLAVLAAITLGFVFGVGYLESRKEEVSGKTSWITYGLIFLTICAYTVIYWLSEDYPVAGDFLSISVGFFIGGYAVILAFQAVHRLQSARRRYRPDRHS